MVVVRYVWTLVDREEVQVEYVVLCCVLCVCVCFFFFFQAEDGIRDSP